MGTSAKIGLVAVLVLIIACAVVWDRKSEEEALQLVRRSDVRRSVLPPQGPARITSITPAERRAPASAVATLPAVATMGSTAVSVSVPPPRFAGTPAPVTIAATTAPATTPAGERRYTVQRGDTFSSIAKRVYGTEARWPTIAEANRDRVSDPSRLMPGTELVIPAATGEPAGGNPAVRAAPGPRTPAGAVTHTVAQEETLFSIAARYYGTGSRWPLIAEANRDRIEDPHRLKPGMVLVIPPATEGR